MPLRRYIPATVVGAIAWAFVYATIGLAAFEAALAAAAGSPLALMILILMVAAAVLGVRLLKVSRRRQLDREAMKAGLVMGHEPVGNTQPQL